MRTALLTLMFVTPAAVAGPDDDARAALALAAAARHRSDRPPAADPFPPDPAVLRAFAPPAALFNQPAPVPFDPYPLTFPYSACPGGNCAPAPAGLRGFFRRW